jgi:uncharacterized membrane protein YgdD (TMEM256/DUF423 family)
MLGGLFAALAVVFGAFAAHGLESKIEPRSIDNIKTGAHYQLTHALGLIAVGVMAGLRRRSADASNPGGFASDSSAGNGWLTSAGVLLTLGIVLFSGSLYCLELSPLVTGAQLRWFGMIAPLGGTSMILGWLALAIGGSRRS